MSNEEKPEGRIFETARLVERHKQNLSVDDLTTKEQKETYYRLVIERDEINSTVKDWEVVDALLYPEPARSNRSIEIIVRGTIYQHSLA